MTFLNQINKRNRKNRFTDNLYLIAFIILLTGFGLQRCVVLSVSTNTIKKPILHTDIPFETTGFLKVDQPYWYWGPWRLSGNDPEELITEQIKKQPKALGVKNFKVRIYDDSLLGGGAGCYAILPFGCLSPVIYSMGGFSYKMLRIRGDFYGSKRNDK